MMLGTIDGRPYYAPRAITPLFPSVPPSRMRKPARVILKMRAGQFWAPPIRKFENGTIETDLLILESSLQLDGITVVDFENSVITRPVDFMLPCHLHGETRFQWKLRKS